MKSSLSQILKDWRKRHHLTQVQAAHELCVPLRTWENWERRVHPLSNRERVLIIIVRATENLKAEREANQFLHNLLNQ